MWMNIENQCMGRTPQAAGWGNRLMLLLCSLLMLATLPAFAQEAVVPAFAEGVVFDASRSTIYTLEPDRLAARRAESGEILWDRTELGEPLALHNGQLVVLGNRDRPAEPVVFWLDPATGATVGELFLDLPDHVNFRIIDAPGESFRARLVTVDNEAFLIWGYSKRQLIGAPAVAGINRAPKMPSVSDSSVRAEQPSEPLSTQIIDTTLVEEKGAMRLETGQAAAVSQTALDSVNRNAWAMLYRGDRSPTVEGEQYRSRAGGHVLASRLSDDDDQWLRHQWTILDDEGEALGRFRLPVAFAPFAVGDKVMAYQSQPYIRFDAGEVLEARDLSLVVMDLESGREAWQAALLDKTWREGMPP